MSDSPEYIWIRSRYRLDPIAEGGIYHDEQPPGESVKYHRDDLVTPLPDSIAEECLLCGHRDGVNADGLCRFLYIESDHITDTSPTSPCGCKCVFAVAEKPPCPVTDAKDAEYDALSSATVESSLPPSPEIELAVAEIDAAWLAIHRGWDIEPRSYFEAEAPKNGFESPLAMAVHYMWKRETKLSPDSTEIQLQGERYLAMTVNQIAAETKRAMIQRVRAIMDEWGKDESQWEAASAAEYIASELEKELETK